MIKVNPQFVPRNNAVFLVSGGVDSISAAHWLKHKYRKEFKVLHFHHDVQELNKAMEWKSYLFTRDELKGSGYITRMRIPDWYPEFSDTSEKGLRDWRHFEMTKLGGNFISAHHIGDCIENYLSNCFNGCPEHEPIPWMSKFEGFSIYHPFLGTTKQDFIDYAEANDLMQYVVEDPSNKDNKMRRNWLRNVIVPELNERDLGIEKVVRKKFYL